MRFLFSKPTKESEHCPGPYVDRPGRWLWWSEWMERECPARGRYSCGVACVADHRLHKHYLESLQQAWKVGVVTTAGHTRKAQQG